MPCTYLRHHTCAASRHLHRLQPVRVAGTRAGVAPGGMCSPFRNVLPLYPEELRKQEHVRVDADCTPTCAASGHLHRLQPVRVAETCAGVATGPRNAPRPPHHVGEGAEEGNGQRLRAVLAAAAAALWAFFAFSSPRATMAACR